MSLLKHTLLRIVQGRAIYQLDSFVEFLFLYSASLWTDIEAGKVLKSIARTFKTKQNTDPHLVYSTGWTVTSKTIVC